MKTLTEYCEQTINEHISFVLIEKNDIDRGDTDINDMTTSIIKSMNAQNIYVYIKLTIEGIRFSYKENVFYLKYNNDNWTLKNKTMQNYLASEAWENRWHKYDDFTCIPKKSNSDSDSESDQYIENTMDC